MTETSLNQGVQTSTEKAAVELFSGSEIIFSIIKSHKATLGAKITDNYIENNTALQDHIAFSPILVTLSGFVGNVVLKSDAAIQQVQDELEQVKTRQLLSNNFFNYENYFDTTSGVSVKLGMITTLFPPMNNNMQRIVYNMANVYDAGRNAIDGLWSRRNNKNSAIITNKQTNPQKTAIQEAYEQISATFYSRLPNTVLTPWATYNNMYIQSVEVTQDELNHIIDLSITFKQLKFANVEYGKVNEQVRASYNEAAAADLENNGKSDNSIMYDGYTPNREYKNW